MGFDDYYHSGEDSQESQQDTHEELSKEEIIKTIETHKVVTDRELKVRLEKQYFPWLVERGLKKLLDTGVVEKVKLSGRRSTTLKTTEGFYCIQGTKYVDIVYTMRQKKNIADSLNTFLTGTSPAAAHAEDLFFNAFQSLGFTIHGRDMSEFQGIKTTGISGKEPPNLDFIVERDGLVYGTDIKNWIRYEFGSRVDIDHKVSIALQLKTIPFIIARHVDKEEIFRLHQSKRNFGMTYRYETLLLPKYLNSLAVEANQLLGYPILAVDILPKYKINWIEKLHQIRLKRKL